MDFQRRMREFLLQVFDELGVEFIYVQFEYGGHGAQLFLQKYRHSSLIMYRFGNSKTDICVVEVYIFIK